MKYKSFGILALKIMGVWTILDFWIVFYYRKIAPLSISQLNQLLPSIISSDLIFAIIYSFSKIMRSSIEYNRKAQKESDITHYELIVHLISPLKDLIFETTINRGVEPHVLQNQDEMFNGRKIAEIYGVLFAFLKHIGKTKTIDFSNYEILFYVFNSILSLAERSNQKGNLEGLEKETHEQISGIFGSKFEKSKEILIAQLKKPYRNEIKYYERFRNSNKKISKWKYQIKLRSLGDIDGVPLFLEIEDLEIEETTVLQKPSKNEKGSEPKTTKGITETEEAAKIALKILKKEEEKAKKKEEVNKGLKIIASTLKTISEKDPKTEKNPQVEKNGM